MKLEDDDEPDYTAIHAHVEGRVQGVGFRYNCYYEARRLGLTGWVRNTPEGDVEVWAEGAAAKLDELLAWLRIGPPHAGVTELRVEKRPALGIYRDFAPEH
jgi:acylphosphatase